MSDSKIKNLKINPRIHKELKKKATDRDLTISEYANILLARSLGLVDRGVDEPAAETVAVLD